MIDLVRKCEEEVVGLHDFFVRWFRGNVEATEAEFSRVERCLGPAFEMVVPYGECRDRQRVIQGIRSVYASLPDTFEIRIRHFEPIVTTDTLVLVRYEEWQTGAGADTRRVSCAAFEPSLDGPCGVQWRYLHETWAPVQTERHG